EDLRRQAYHLAVREPRRPQQASLRRAVSAAYYALFHLLIDEATLRMFGGRRDRRRFRYAVARGFSHQSMVATCKSFRGGTLPVSVVTSVGTLIIPADLRDVGRVFAMLQEE